MAESEVCLNFVNEFVIYFTYISRFTYFKREIAPFKITKSFPNSYITPIHNIKMDKYGYL